MRDHFEAVCEEQRDGDLWVLVLAGGDGTRLSDVSEALYGYARPKQFCALVGQDTLLEDTVHRAELIVPRERIVVSTTRRWRAEAFECLAQLPGVHLVEQPSNRGTAVGLLDSLLYILSVDPGARVIVMPADHHFDSPAVVLAPAMLAAQRVMEEPDRIALLGAQMHKVEDGLGWIDVAARPEAGGWHRVNSFVEKPPLAEAEALRRRGALANIFVLVSRASTLCTRMAEYVPNLWRQLTESWGSEDQREAAFRSLGSVDLSKQVLTRCVDDLRAVPVVGGWSDLGVPERLAQVVERHAPGGAVEALGLQDRGKVIAQFAEAS